MNIYASIALLFLSFSHGFSQVSNTGDIKNKILTLEQLFYKGEWAYDVNSTGLCHEILDRFSLAASQFILCANEHAKPISMCKDCFPYYINLTTSYKDLKTHKENKMSCMDILTSQDRLEIVQETYQYIAGKKPPKGIIASTGKQGLWSKGNCESCYSSPFRADSVLSAVTVDFFSRHTIVKDCFKKFPYQEDIPRNSSQACQVCQPFYQNLSDFYEEYVLDDEAPFICDVCIDIVDAMNLTQRQWGEKYNCGRKVEHHIPLLVMVSCVLCTPLFFYSLVRLAETSAEERVISQRNITNFLDNNLRRLSFNRRSRVSRSSRHVSREQFNQPQGLYQSTEPQNNLSVPSSD
eukprot:TRINITY_DN16548_c0_g1_i1.p1 TRINITY_DN16548_c0_g1~~TRINITY_DN16548_c0_g1_i1.p1  ORF type:complete len:350 (-),score=43.27 TRINITY_DN16548_c0_g1_i1:122-1171(-)